MRKAVGSFRYAILILLAMLAAMPARPQDRGRAMAVKDVMDLLTSQYPSSGIAKAVKEFGINFELTPELERRFRRAGADDDVIAALRSVSKNTGEVTTPSGSAGGIEIHTQPGEAQVYLNDELKGMSSPEGRLRISSLAPGSYTVRVSLPGYQSWQRSVTVSAGETASVMAPLAQSTTTTGTTSSITTTSSIASAIPLPDVKVDSVNFFESGADMPEVGKRTYLTVFSSGSARNINYELNLSWGKIASRVDFDLDAVWYGPAGNVINRKTHASHVEPAWFDDKTNSGGSVHADSYGCDTAPCNAWSTPGTYIVELYVKGVKVASGAFQITAGVSPPVTVSTPTVSANSRTFTISAVPLPNVSLYSLKMFESGRGTPDEDKRVYQNVYSKSSALYINWELHLTYGTIPARTDWDTYTAWYGPDGTVFAHTSVHAHAMPDWGGGVMYLDGWGCDTAPCSAWTRTGNYTVELFVRGVKIASTSFVIQ